MRVGRLERAAERGLARRFGRFVFGEFFEAAPHADGINVALSEHGAKPSLQRTAAVEVTEERTLGALGLF